MRRRRRHLGSALIGSMSWRRLPQLLAVLALFANAALLPTLHFASRSPAEFLAAASPGEASHPALHHGHGGQKETDGASHQVCHFCRLIGVALPPPPSVAIEAASVAEAVTWRVPDDLIEPGRHVRSANLPRAPPPAV